jgi:hypothetical protein
MSLVTPKPRRTILQFGLVAASAAVTPHAFAQAARDKARKANESKANDSKVEEVTPPEDLMREHGVLDRVLLIYEAAGRKLDAKEDFDPKVVTDAAAIVRTFIEDYHEKSEEDFIFPRFRKAGQLADLVDTLKTQHDAGRRVTMKISSVAPRSRQDDGARRDPRIRRDRRRHGKAGASAFRRRRIRENRRAGGGPGKDHGHRRSAPVHAHGVRGESALQRFSENAPPSRRR